MKTINQIQTELEAVINNINALRQDVTEIQSQPVQDEHTYYFTAEELSNFVRLIVNDCEQGAKSMLEMAHIDLSDYAEISWDTNGNIAEATIELDHDSICTELAREIDFDTDDEHCTKLAETAYHEIIMNRLAKGEGDKSNTNA